MKPSADDIPASGQVVIGIVGEFEDVIRTPKHREEGRRLAKHFRQARALDRQRLHEVLIPRFASQ